MKRTDFLKEIRGLSREDLVQRARSLAEELMKLRFRKSTGQLEQFHRLQQLRRDFARIKSTLRKTGTREKGEQAGKQG
jgi:large subunit ribosomal protein L29